MRMTSRAKRFWTFGVAAIAILVAIFFSGAIHRTIRLTAPEIQSELAAKFPLEKRQLLFTARFTDPTVSIDPLTSRITLGFSTTVSALGMKAATGRAEGEGAIRYEPSSGELFLDSPVVKVKGFELTGLPEKYQHAGSDLIAKGLQEYLVHTPIYRLSDKDSKLLSARRALKSIHIKDGTVLIELGL